MTQCQQERSTSAVLAAAVTYVPYPSWLNPGDNTWQITAATFVGLMSLPGLAVLYASIVPKKWAVNVLAMMFAGFSLVLIAWFAVGLQDGLRRHLPRGGVKNGVQTQLSGSGGWTHFFDNFVGQTGPGARVRKGTGPGGVGGQHGHPVPLPDGVAGLLPVRVRRHHPAAVPRERARPDQVQRLVPARAAVVDLRLRGRRLPAVGWRLLRPGGCTRLLRWVRHPHVGRCVGLRGRLGPRTQTATGPTALPAQQPGHGGRRCRHPVARLERLQRW